MTNKHIKKQFMINPKIRQSKSRGFTLIELVVYLGVIMIFFLVLTDILTSVLNTRLSSQSNSQVAQDGRYIYTRLVYDIERADSISLPLNIGDTSNSLQMSISGTPYTYSLSNSNLILTVSGSSEQLNSVDTSISNLSFRRIGNANGKNTFQILFTVTSRITNRGLTDSQAFQTTAGLR